MAKSYAQKIAPLSADIFTDVEKIVTVSKKDLDADYAAQLESIAKKAAALISINEPAQAKDTITTKLVSRAPKFNRENITLSAGVGFFNKAVEEALVGMTIGEAKTIEIDGIAVQITITGIKRNKPHEINDALIQMQNLEGVNTLEQYKKHFVTAKLEELRQNKAFELMFAALEDCIEKSDIVVDPEEVNTFVESTIAAFLESDGGLKGAFDFFQVSDEQGLREIVKKDSVKRIKEDIITETYGKSKGYEFELTKKDYDEYTEKYYQEQGFETVEERRATLSIEDFIKYEPKRLYSLFFYDDFMKESGVRVVIE